MPTYDYACDACGHTFEKFQSMSSSPVKKCPQCAKNKVRRLPGIGAGVIFKGSGFYCTDYRSDSYRASATKDKPSDSSTSTPASTEPAAKSETKSESKPASDKAKKK